jgi:hypothetical protein
MLRIQRSITDVTLICQQLQHRFITETDALSPTLRDHRLSDKITYIKRKSIVRKAVRLRQGRQG